MADRPTEMLHPDARGLHLRDGAGILSLLLDAQASALGALRPALPQMEQAADLAAAAVARGGKLAYAGAGSSGVMALSDCLELAGTFGIAPQQTPMLFAGGAAALIHLTGGVEDDPAQAQADLDAAGLTPGDVLIAVSASGSTPYTIAVARAARAAGVAVIGIANTPDAALLMLADVAICLNTGAEVIAGSTRMGAATAQKVALNLISTLMGIRLGHVHDGHMVNVVADNAKLIDRAARIVADVTGATLPVAKAALNATDGAVKSAILVVRGHTPDAARSALAASKGHLAPLLTA
ncbi:MAG: N-acetylmuramic acid 6-phosphate etherase [Pseudomonadota bacterium]